MKRLLFAVPLALALIGCASAPSAPATIDYGRFEGNVFSNEFFGVSIAVPEGWAVQDAATMARLAEQGTEMLYGDDEEMQRVIEAAEVESLQFFGAYRYPLGSAVDFNPSVILMAENLKNAPGVADGGDYLFHAKRLLDQSSVEFRIVKDTYPVTVNGTVLHALDIAITYLGNEIRQRYYTRVMNGFAVAVVITWTDDEALAALDGAVATLRFERG